MARLLNLFSITWLWQSQFFSILCWGYFTWMQNRSHKCPHGKAVSSEPWSWGIPKMEGLWLDGGHFSCQEVMNMLLQVSTCMVRPLFPLSSALWTKTQCFLGSSTSIPWEPVELQSSASMCYPRIWPYFPWIPKWKTPQGLALTSWEDHGCWAASQSSTLAGCRHSSWPTKRRKRLRVPSLFHALCHFLVQKQGVRFRSPCQSIW